MKKLLAIILSVLAMATLLSVASFAGTVDFEEGYISDGDFMLASFNGTKPFFADSANVEEVENAAYWLSDNAESFNLKFVSFLGNMSSQANYTYANVVQAGVGTQADLLSLNEGDTEWQEDFESLKNVAEVFSDSGIAYGVSIGKNDYAGIGFDRINHVQTTFTMESFIGESGYKYEQYDTNNFAVIFNVNGVNYIVYQLEAFPQSAVITWFNSVQAKHSDKRAIVFTTSFIDASGEMYTQHDWVESGGRLPSNYRDFSTNLTSNMLNHGQPHDGINIWNYGMKMWDNIVLVVSDNATPGTEIVVNKFKNNNGVEVAAVLADLQNGYGKSGRAYPLLMKISADNKTIDFMYGDYDSTLGYLEESFKSITLKKIGSLPEPDPVTLLPKVDVQVNGANTAYIKGYEDNTFRPNGNMTKAEASAIFARLLSDKGEIPTGNTTRFEDVLPGEWYYDAIAYLDSIGYYLTTEGTQYNPNAEITRAEFVELAYFASNYSSGTSVKFKDVDENNKYYKAISASSALGLVNGYEDGTFKPEGKITRAEVVTVINRMLSLLAIEKTVSKEHVENKFTDIEGHWAEYTILMASNDNVKGGMFYDVKPGALQEDKKYFYIENDTIKITVAKKGAKITSVINKYTGKEIMAETTTPWISWLTTTSGAIIQPTKLEIIDSIVYITYKNGLQIAYIYDVQPHYFTVTLATNLPSTVLTSIICNVPVNEYWELDNANAYGISAVPMTTTIEVSHTPGGYGLIARGLTYTTLGQTQWNPNPNIPTIGSKVGIAFSRMTEHREHLKEITLLIDRKEGVQSFSGGAYAYDNHDIYTDYVILSSGLTLETVEETAKVCQKYAIGYIDMHQSTSGTFNHSEFNFVCARNEREQMRGAFIDAATFKERIVDVLNAHDVNVSLHTFSSLLESKAETIVTVPKYQKQISYDLTTYTLRGDLTKRRTNVKTYEDASGVIVRPQAIPYSTVCQSRYILVDEEIMLIQQGTSSGFLNVKRGQLGTKAADHEDGAEIRQLTGWYNMFQPQPGSELFYLVASNTGKATYESGAKMIYLDGFESFARPDFTPDSRTRYYFYAEFAREILETVQEYGYEDPMIEMSCFNSSFWGARARGGATDTSMRSYKPHKAAHIKSQTQYLRYFYTATVGWQQYDPDSGERYKDVAKHTMHKDDMDFMGSLSLAYNFSTVYQPFSLAAVNATTRLADNIEYYSVYSKLRMADYFSPEVKAAIIAGKYEFKLFQQADGTFAFKEMTYVKHKVYNMDVKELNAAKGNNPFGAQTPFIRIEQKYSTMYENEKLLIEFDETVPVTELTGKRHSMGNIDASNLYAFKIRVHGNGSSTGGIMLRFYGGLEENSGGWDDRFIPLDFEGWQDIILVEADNDECQGYTFTGMSYGTVSYSVYRIPVNFKSIKEVSVHVTGDCSNAFIDDIYGYTLHKTTVKNPSVTINGQTFTFDTELKSGDYVEFYPEFGKAYHSYYTDVYSVWDKYTNSNKYVYEEVEGATWYKSEAHTEEISYSGGDITVPSGSFEYSYSAETDETAVIRAQVEIGFAGDVVANPDTWVAPEVDVDASLLIPQIY